MIFRMCKIPFFFNKLTCAVRILLSHYLAGVTYHHCNDLYCYTYHYIPIYLSYNSEIPFFFFNFYNIC